MEKNTVLIVDDIKENIFSMRELLSVLDVNIQEARSGEECLLKLLEEQIDIVLLDIQMPGMDGYEAAQYIRGNEKTKNIPIIFITAANHSNVIDLKAYDAGAIDIMYKPVIKDILISKVQIFIDMIETRKKLEEQVITLRNLNARNLELTKEVEKLASTDFLTNIPNRRTLDVELKRQFKNAVREQKEISSMMIDIDDFKKYNDSYGHQQGDIALREVADSISASIKRPIDMVGRFGGEEFLVILPNTDKKGAESVANEILKNVRAKKLESKTKTGIVTVSIGISTMLPDPSLEYFDLVECADTALYDAKENQKNCFKHYSK